MMLLSTSMLLKGAKYLQFCCILPGHSQRSPAGPSSFVSFALHLHLTSLAVPIPNFLSPTPPFPLLHVILPNFPHLSLSASEEARQQRKGRSKLEDRPPFQRGDDYRRPPSFRGLVLERGQKYIMVWAATTGLCQTLSKTKQIAN